MLIILNIASILFPLLLPLCKLTDNCISIYICEFIISWVDGRGGFIEVYVMTIFRLPSLCKIQVECQQTVDVCFLSIDLLFFTVATRNIGICFPHKIYFSFQQLLYLMIDL